MRAPFRIPRAVAAAGGTRLHRALLDAARAQLAGRADLRPAQRAEAARQVALRVAERLPRGGGPR